MLRRLQLVLALLSFSLMSMAAIVPDSVARIVAIHFIQERFLSIQQLEKVPLIVSSFTVERNGFPVYYTYNFKGGGYVQVAAEDAAYPILSFDLSNQVEFGKKQDNYDNWMQNYIDQILFIRMNQLTADQVVSRAWTLLINGQNASLIASKSSEPLLLSKWNQGSLYNADCPEDVNGPGGRVYAGCVAVAMAQVMYYYRFPAQGQGNNSYYHYAYGTQSANFGTATYQWNDMVNVVDASGNSAVANLLYHLGVSVEMDYGASGSGAYSQNAALALINYFKYQSSVGLEDKSDFTYAQWVAKIVNSIDSKIPLYYHGYDNQGGGGHAFNLDGYQGSDHFHFNWGWGGSYDGYFYLSALNPGSSNFINGQGAIFNIFPSGTFPLGCSSNTKILNGLRGNFDDGSSTVDYLANQNCSWLIQPDSNIDHITLTFDRFNLSADDTLFIYNGNSSADSLLKKLSGSQLPSSVSSNGNKVFLQLMSNNANQSSGFDISYHSYYPIYCGGTAYFTDSSYTFSDGSGPNSYSNNSLCRWMIEPSNGFPIRLEFSAFHTETNEDYVKIYDPTPTPSLLLASFTGQSIPTPVVSSSGKMMVIFNTNQSQVESGWTAHYVTGPSVGFTETKSMSSIKVFPNPSTSRIYLKNQDAVNPLKSVSIFSLEGKILENVDFRFVSASLIEMYVQHLAAGFYLLKIETSEGFEMQKVMIE